MSDDRKKCLNCIKLRLEIEALKKRIRELEKIIENAIDTAQGIGHNAERNMAKGNMGKGAYSHYEGELETAKAILSVLGQSYCSPAGLRIAFRKFRGFLR